MLKYWSYSIVRISKEIFALMSRLQSENSETWIFIVISVHMKLFTGASLSYARFFTMETHRENGNVFLCKLCSRF
ncbi:hypothetical protein BDV37DRAFT_56420 [Aspergillus pseudonomiae]|uniref:Uncharacterized protein n=1 Tax=Aspergillus pseudonomiae TaxID=1506151 RepID=A0A5N7CT75_9EURO|nr:uncharacterized protein BDV37DRAFT_56420 [Aspergillus pseudonomiae]KAE8397432.1 hypothetical protein BDV37DRAFT_56420 [Aspergillus pseudonomiae]